LQAQNLDATALPPYTSARSLQGMIRKSVKRFSEKVVPRGKKLKLAHEF